jgi:hypothetical protein
LRVAAREENGDLLAFSHLDRLGLTRTWLGLRACLRRGRPALQIIIVGSPSRRGRTSSHKFHALLASAFAPYRPAGEIAHLPYCLRHRLLGGRLRELPSEGSR